jgi:hypothetical protein
MRSLDTRTLDPINSKGRELLDFDRVVEAFKKYVYHNGADLRAKAVHPDASALEKSYRYEVAFHKSSHHLKMENNHAVIEDLNTFGRFGGPQCSFYGVFDGHGGYLISEYLSLHLAGNIARHPSFHKSIPDAIRGSFMKTDEDIAHKIQRDVSNNLFIDDLINLLGFARWINMCGYDIEGKYIVCGMGR